MRLTHLWNLVLKSYTLFDSCDPHFLCLKNYRSYRNRSLCGQRQVIPSLLRRNSPDLPFHLVNGRFWYCNDDRVFKWVMGCLGQGGSFILRIWRGIKINKGSCVSLERWTIGSGWKRRKQTKHFCFSALRHTILSKSGPKLLSGVAETKRAAAPHTQKGWMEFLWTPKRVTSILWTDVN